MICTISCPCTICVLYTWQVKQPETRFQLDSELFWF